MLERPLGLVVSTNFVADCSFQLRVLSFCSHSIAVNRQFPRFVGKNQEWMQFSLSNKFTFCRGCRGQFNETFAHVSYKYSYCSQTLKQWLHL